MYWTLHCGYWGEEAKNCSTHKKWSPVAFYFNVKKVWERAWTFKAVSSITTHSYCSAEQNLQVKKAVIYHIWYYFPKKGHSIITSFSKERTRYHDSHTLNEFLICTGTNLVLLTSKKVQSLGQALQIISWNRAVSCRNITSIQKYWWYNSLTPRHVNLVNGHSQKQKRCSEPVSSGYLGHALNSALFLGQEGGWLKSTEWDGKHWVGLSEILWQNSYGATARPDLCFSYPTPRSYFQMFINWLVPWAAEG